MILETVLSTLTEHDAFSVGGVAVLAVSGGCDSVVLLHVMKRLRAQLDIDLHIASLNHGIRGESAARDLELVRDLAERWRIPCTLGQADVPQLADDWSVGIEEAARRARYGFLAKVARQEGSNCVALGHHMLDQVETILMNIARGSGIRGLRGMQVLTEMPCHPHIRLIRPLLDIAREELRAYCVEHQLPFRVDESNDDTAYRRNFVRHELLPRLKRLNPDVLSAFSRLAESAAVDEDFIAAQFESNVKPLVNISANRWSIGIDAFAELHPALRRRFIREAFRQLAGGSLTLSYALTRELIAWSQEAEVGSRRDIGASIKMRVGYEDLSIEGLESRVDSGAYRLIPGDADIRIRTGQSLLLDGLHVSLSAGRRHSDSGVELVLPADSEIRLRTRRGGERFKPKGMGGHSRKIKEWMIDRKIPRELRDQIPLVCADGEIIAICLGDTWHLADTSHLDKCDAFYLTLILA